METSDKFRTKLREKGLRCTNARLEVLRILDAADRPLSHSEVVNLHDLSLGHQATVYRTLISLSSVGLAIVSSRAGGIDRYELCRDGGAIEHQVHPHFVCNDCGTVSCLPQALVSINTDQNWEHWLTLVERAEFQFVGTCLDCQPTEC